METKQCLHCQTDFIPARSDAKFCSQSCRQMAYAERINSNNPANEFQEASVPVNTPETIKDLTLMPDVCTTSLPSISDVANDELTSVNRQEINRKKKRNAKKRWKKQQYLSRINQQIDELHEKMDFMKTNYLLKGWIEKLLEFESRKTKVFKYELESLLQSINFSLNDEQCKISSNYNYLGFIQIVLFPKLKQVMEYIEKKNRLTFKFTIDESLRKELTDILCSIEMK